MMFNSPFRRFAYVALATGVLALPAAAQIKQYVHPHACERDGVLVGIAWNLTGGQVVWQQSTDAAGGSVVTKTFAPFSALFSLYGNDFVFKAVSDALNGVPNDWSHKVTRIGLLTENGICTFPTLSEAVFPGGDVESKDPDGVVLTYGMSVYSSAGALSRSASEFNLLKNEARKQKLWSSANFRLTIGSLPCSRVKSTGPIAVQFPSFIERRSFPVGTCTPLESDRSAFVEMAKLTAAGTPKELPFRMDYLDEDGNTIMSLVSTVVITSVDKADVFDPYDPADAKNADKPIKVRYEFRGHITLMK